MRGGLGMKPGRLTAFFAGNQLPETMFSGNSTPRKTRNKKNSTVRSTTARRSPLPIEAFGHRAVVYTAIHI